MNCKSIREAIDTAPRRSGYGETVRAHLNDCSDCHRYADEISSLLALLNAQPRVEAPADFDFRLRARIARAKSEPKPVAGALESLWSKSFSFGQAATAMAAMTIAIFASTFYFMHHDEMATPNDSVANMIHPITPPVDNRAEEAVTRVINTEVVKATGAASKSTSHRMASSNYRPQKPVALQPASSESVIPAPTVAMAGNSDRFYHRANRQVITTSPNRDLIGAEGVAFTKPRTETLTF